MKPNLIPLRAKQVLIDVANLIERKNPHIPVNGVKEFVHLRTGKTERAEIFFGHLWQKATSHKFLFV